MRSVEAVRRVVGVQMLHQLAAAGEINALRGHRNADTVGQEQAEIPRRTDIAREHFVDIDGMNVVHVLGELEGQRAVSRADFHHRHVRPQEPAEQRHLLRDVQLRRFRGVLQRTAWMIRHSTEQLLVQAGKHAEPLLAGRCAQPGRKLLLCLVMDA